MLERFLFALIPLVSTPAPAAPVEEYSRLQTQFVNQLKETSTGIALPAQDFKRYSAVATFTRQILQYDCLSYSLWRHGSLFGSREGLQVGQW